MAQSDANDFEQWITDRLDFTTGTPLSGNTGDMEQWITDRLDFATFNKKEDEGRTPRYGFILYQVPAIV